MKALKTIVAILICCSSFAQGKTFYNTHKHDGDSTFWFKYQTAIARKLSLPILDTSTKSKYVRIWTDTQAIDIWQDVDGEFRGVLTTWTDEHVPYDEKPTNRTFIKTKQLSADSLRLLTELLTSNNILLLPTDDSIKGWKQGFDGITYIVEHSTKDYYAFKSYWTPEAQGSLREAIQLQTFIDNAFSLANARTVWKEFSKEIPFECYINGGPSVACKVLTTKQRKTYIKERRNYRQQQLSKIRAKE